MFTSFNARALGLNLTAQESIELAAEAGFEGVDLLVRELIQRGENPVELRKRMDNLSLRGGAFVLPVDWRSRDLDRFRNDLNNLPRYAEAANQLGLLTTGTWVFPEMETDWLDVPELDIATETVVPPEKTNAERMVCWTAHWLAPVVRILSEAGITLGIEWIGSASFRIGRPVPVIHSLRDPMLRALVDLLNSPYQGTPPVGMLYDAFHLFASGDLESPERAWAEKHAVWVHVADLPADSHLHPGRSIQDDDRGLPGDCGIIPVGDFLKRLERAHYKGPVTAEPLGTCRTLQNLSAKERAHAALASLKGVWPQNDPSQES